MGNNRICLFAGKVFFLVLVFSFVEVSAIGGPSDLFNSSWNTSLPGVSNDTSIKLPLILAGSYNFTVDWGDGSNDTILVWNDAATTHDYGVEGVYNVSIDGEIVGWQFNNGGDKDKILDISNWGSLNVGNSLGYFYGCSNLDSSATDVLNLSGTVFLTSMFSNAYNFNGNISGWDVSLVTYMDDMFNSAASFNRDLSSWDVSSVVGMERTFMNATSFNGNVSGWNTSSVTGIEEIFSHATSFNQDLDGWDVAGIWSLTGMFWNATSFNGNISSWDVSSADDMESMFWNAVSFNGNISSWVIAASPSMYGMFSGAINFNGDIGGWDISSVSSMDDMFSGVNLSVSAYDNLLIGWSGQSVQSGVGFHGGFSKYSSSASSARDILVSSNSWTISDGGLYVAPVVEEEDDSSGSSSGSSGGGSSRIDLGDLDDLDFEGELRFGYIGEFDVGGKKYSLSLRSVDRSKGVAVFYVSSEGKVVEVKIGEGAQFDLDDDGDLDFVLNLESIDSRASAVGMKLSLIDSGSGSDEALVEDVVQEGLGEAEEVKGSKILDLSWLLVLLVVLVVIWVFIKSRYVKSAKKKKK